MIDPGTSRPVLTTLVGTTCKDQDLKRITDWYECLKASKTLGLPWGGYHKDGAGPEYDFPGCVLIKKDGRNKVHFNQKPKPTRANLKSTFAAICETARPGNKFQG